MAAIHGFVFAGFRFDELMAGILGNRSEGVHFELYDGTQATPETLMYQSKWPSSRTPITDNERHPFSGELTLSISGKPWLIRLHADQDFIDRQEALAPYILGISGLFINFLIFVSLTLIARNRRQMLGSLEERDAAIELLQETKHQLSEKENTLRNLMDSLSASVALIDSQGNILQVNQAWQEFGNSNGACADLCAGKKINYLQALKKAAEANAPGAREILDRLDRLIAGEIDFFAIEYPCHSSATERWFQLNANRMQDATGQFVISHTDITASYTAKLEISRYADMLESCHTPILLIAADGDLLSANPAAHALLQTKPAKELIGLINEQLPNVISGATLGLHFNSRASDHGKTHLQLTLSPHIEQGQVTSAVVVVHDVTDLHQAQERLEIQQVHLEHIVNARTVELLASQDRLKTILETTAEGIICTDENGIIDFANPAAEELLAYQPGSLLGLPMHATIHHHHKDGSEHRIEECPVHISLQGGPDPYGFEDSFWCADGSRLSVSYSSRKIIQHGAIRGCVVAFSDITDRKATDTAREIALNAAEHLAQVKTDFLANMSHEIRTPLNAVIASAMLMERDEIEPRQRERLQRIVHSSQHLLRLINDILDFSKLEAGKIELEKSDFRIQDVLTGVTSQMAEVVRQKGLAWHTVVDPKIAQILKGDALRIGQILLNFSSNATKFTEQGEISLSARLLAEKDFQQLIRFEVLDTGRGFDPAKAQSLFDSFVQEDASTTRQYGGTGLGLAISKQLVELMHGRIGAESTPGVGSCFWFEIQVERSQTPIATVSEKPLSLRGRRAIILAQNEEFVTRLREQLGSQLITLQSAITAGEIALRVETAARIGRPYDFVFCSQDGQNVNALCDRSIQMRLRNPAMEHTPKCIHFHDLSKSANAHEIHLDCFDAHLPENFEAVELFQLLVELLGETPRSQTARSTGGSATPQLSSLSHCRILLVEDNPINQQVAMDMLQSVGLSAEIADNGRDALVLAENRRYDLILMDMQMPVMGGLDATREIRRLPDYAEVPIIALTANAFESHRQECLRTGMNDFLTKPVNPEKLYAKLQQWLPSLTEHHAQPPTTALNTTEFPSVLVIDGVNVSLGLTQLSGNRAKYLKLLQQLVNEHSKDHELIGNALQSGDLVTARRLAHSLKGTAGMLSAEAVSAASKAIEQGIDQRLDEIEMSHRISRLGETLMAIAEGLKNSHS